MRKQHVVVLSEQERARLHTLIGQGSAPARALSHARILLKANQGEAGPGWTDRAIATALEVHHTTVARVRQQYAAGGLAAAVDRKAPDREYPRKLDGEQEARLVVLACSAPPEGRKRWTLRLLAERLVQLEVVDAVSHETVRQALKPNKLKPWLKERWCIPPGQDAEFVWRMEDVLEVYTRPYDPRRPLVCLDETSRQLLAQARPPLAAAPGQPAREDYEYERRGVCNLFLACEPLRGWRDVMVSARRTRIDWAHCIKALADVHYPDAEAIVLVQDNLNTHTPASLYEAFEPAEARRLAGRLELHYTPKHGSWLNMAEIELAALAGQCLDRRLADRATMEREVEAWQLARNASGRGVNWRFTTADARIKLKHLYPAIQD
ncbi:MAG TPA: IS630 family transposase [Novosphingobium sp.]|nr:IS630 family transposase [Novosphingobium sp.]